MAKLEIPSIVVYNGTSSTPSSPKMDCSLRSQHVLSKQDEFEEVEDEVHAAKQTESDDCAADGKPEVPADHENGSEKCSSNSDGSLTEKASLSTSSDLSDQSTATVSPSPDASKHSDETKTGRRRSQAKVRLLVRSHAMREAMSPPPDPDVAPPLPAPPPLGQVSAPTTLTALSTAPARPSSRHSLRNQGSSQGSADSSSPCLSRDSSTEQPYTDSSGTELLPFIIETLNKNQKDRIQLLKLEQDLILFVKDAQRPMYKFPPMSSYHRMLVHRVAAYFGMEHNVDQSGNAVIVAKTKNTRIPDVRFREHIKDELLPEEPKKLILKRDSSSFEESAHFKSPERQLSAESRRSKSFEEREEEYEKARKRIFNQDEGIAESPLCSQESTSRRSSQEDLRWAGDVRVWSSTDSDGAKSAPAKVETDNQLRRPNRLLKVESFESRDSMRTNSHRPAVSKSNSFGGYTSGSSVITRDDSVTSTQSEGVRLLTKQDSNSSGASRLSPCSSGYKSHSLRSDTSTTPSPTPSHQHLSLLQSQDSSQAEYSTSESPSISQAVQIEYVLTEKSLVWAVSDLHTIPPGSVLINPQTGQPYLNEDGSIYRYDCNNIPEFLQTGGDSVVKHSQGSTANEPNDVPGDSSETQNDKKPESALESHTTKSDAPESNTVVLAPSTRDNKERGEGNCESQSTNEFTQASRTSAPRTSPSHKQPVRSKSATDPQQDRPLRRISRSGSHPRPELPHTQSHPVRSLSRPPPDNLRPSSSVSFTYNHSTQYHPPAVGSWGGESGQVWPQRNWSYYPSVVPVLPYMPMMYPPESDCSKYPPAPLYSVTPGQVPLPMQVPPAPPVAYASCSSDNQTPPHSTVQQLNPHAVPFVGSSQMSEQQIQSSELSAGVQHAYTSNVDNESLGAAAMQQSYYVIPRVITHDGQAVVDMSQIPRSSNVAEGCKYEVQVPQDHVYQGIEGSTGSVVCLPPQAAIPQVHSTVTVAPSLSQPDSSVLSSVVSASVSTTTSNANSARQITLYAPSHVASPGFAMALDPSNVGMGVGMAMGMGNTTYNPLTNVSSETLAIPLGYQQSGTPAPILLQSPAVDKATAPTHQIMVNCPQVDSSQYNMSPLSPLHNAQNVQCKNTQQHPPVLACHPVVTQQPAIAGVRLFSPMLPHGQASPPQPPSTTADVGIPVPYPLPLLLPRAKVGLPDSRVPGPGNEWLKSVPTTAMPTTSEAGIPVLYRLPLVQTDASMLNPAVMGTRLPIAVALSTPRAATPPTPTRGSGTKSRGRSTKSRGASSATAASRGGEKSSSDGNVLEVEGLEEGLTREDLERKLVSLLPSSASVTCFYKGQWTALSSLPAESLATTMPPRIAFGSNEDVDKAHVSFYNAKLVLREPQS